MIRTAYHTIQHALATASGQYYRCSCSPRVGRTLALALTMRVRKPERSTHDYNWILGPAHVVKNDSVRAKPQRRRWNVVARSWRVHRNIEGFEAATSHDITTAKSVNLIACMSRRYIQCFQFNILLRLFGCLGRPSWATSPFVKPSR